MPKELFLLDSTYATRNYDPITRTIDDISYNSFNIWFPLKYQLKNLNRTTLKSVRLPLILNNVWPFNGTTTISFCFINNRYINITLSNWIIAGTYTSIASLITAIIH